MGRVGEAPGISSSWAGRTGLGGVRERTVRAELGLEEGLRGRRGTEEGRANA